MAEVIILPTNPTDEHRATYAAQLNSVRRLASPNAQTPLTSDQLPDEFITDPIYLDAQERYVLRKLKKSGPYIAGSDHARVVYLIQLRIAMKLIPQLPGILRQTMVGETLLIRDVDWEKRLEDLEDEYNEETEDIVEDSGTAKIKVKVLATDKRPWPPNTTYNPFWR